MFPFLEPHASMVDCAGLVDGGMAKDRWGSGVPGVVPWLGTAPGTCTLAILRLI